VAFNTDWVFNIGASSHRAGLCGTVLTPRIITKSSEVIDMAEQKAKPATKKVAAAKAVTTAKKVTLKKPAAKKTAAAAGKKAVTPVAKKVTGTKSRVKKVAITAKPAATKKTEVKPTPEEHYRMVEITAYFIAERNGFQGDSTEYWSAAEREIAAKLDW
jgi:uncharacterized membrane protein